MSCGTFESGILIVLLVRIRNPPWPRAESRLLHLLCSHVRKIRDFLNEFQISTSAPFI